MYSIENPYIEDDTISRIGYYDNIHNENGVGQFINNYCMFDLNNNLRSGDNGIFSLSDKIINKKIEKYIKISLEKSNVELKENFKIYAKRDILQEEELYLSYGIHYWISLIKLKSDEPLTRLYCLLKSNFVCVITNKLSFKNKMNNSTDVFDAISILPNGNMIKFLNLQNYSNDKKLIELIKLLM